AAPGAMKGVVVPYLTEVERKELIISVRGGRLFDSLGAPLNTGANLAHYVMDEYGTIYVRKFSTEDLFHHSSFMAGAPVAGAGLLRAEEGELLEINGQSGHYEPDLAIYGQVLDELESRKVKLPFKKADSR